MGKNEFLRVLREQLEGRLSQDTIEGHIRYYDQYIDAEVRMGKSEEQVMGELGSPIFIAKTLSDMAEGLGEEYDQETAGRSEEAYYEEYAQEEQGFWQKAVGFLFGSGLARIVIPLVIVFVMMLAFWLLGTVAMIAFRLFSPLILVFLLYYIFKRLTGR